MNEHNPYAAPSANLGGKDSYGQGSGGVTQGVVDQLARTKGWTRFVGVMLIIAACFILLMALLGGAGMGAALSGFGGRGGGELGTAFFIVFFVIFGTGGALCLIAGLKLNGFSTAIQRLLFSGQERDLDDALDRQRSFWLFAGILHLIAVIFMVIAVIGALMAPTPRFPANSPLFPVER